MKQSFRPFSALALLVALLLGSSAIAFGQFQWSSYDSSGNLLNANAATGGDLASGTTVTFTIPAGTQMSFMTKSFTPFGIAGASTKKVVTFNVSVSGGLAGVTQRTMGWGLYNSAGTAGLNDDVGYYGLWNGGGPYLEPYDHTSGSANLFSGTKLGQGTVNTGSLANGVTYTNQIQLDMNSTATGISVGSSSSTLAAAGLAMNGPGATERIYSSAVTPLLGSVSSFDEFGFMFNNTTGSPITVTLSGIALGNTLTWDASGANPAAPTDGSGIWSMTNANWSSKAQDTVWSSGYNVVIGSGNGAAGVISNADGAGELVSNITFNAAGSGGYNIIGTPLVLQGTPTITVASGVSATNSAQLGGTGFIKAGAGELVLLPTVAATNAGPTTVNAGTLFLAGTGTGATNLNGDLIVNSGALVQIAGNYSIPSASRFFINGGAVTNVSASNPTLTYNIMAIDNGGILASAGAQIGQLCVTNFDFRSGYEGFAKFPATMITNFSVKSTSGTVDVQSRANSSGSDGIGGLNINAGTFICDYANPAPNGDTTGGAKYINTVPMTLAGGNVYQRFLASNNRTESVGGVNVIPGHTFVEVTNNSATAINYTFAQGAITRKTGGTVDYSVGGTSTGTKACTTTTANTDGIIGGFATYAGADWAAGTTIVPYTGYSTSADPTTWVTANNVSLSGNPLSSVPASTTINTLKLNGSSAISLSGVLTLTTGGLLSTGTGANSISGGTLEGASGADLIIHQYSSGALTINSALADNGSATSLTKSGSGTVVIAGTDSMSGTNYLNGGILSVSALNQLAAGPLVMNNGTLDYTGVGETSTRPIILNGVGGTIEVDGGVTVTQAISLLGGGGFNSPLTPGLNLGDWGGLTKTGTGTLILATNNIYNGLTAVNNGALLVNGTNSLTGTSGLTNYSGGGTVTVYGGTLGGTGMISGAVDIKSGGTLAPGNTAGTLTLGNGLTTEGGSTNLFNFASGVGTTVAVQGNLAIQPNSTIAVNVTGSSLQPSTNTLITYTGTLSGSFNSSVVVVGGSINGSLSIDTSTQGEVNLDVTPQVAIVSQPQDETVSTNDPATFSVGATGSATIDYQWYYYGDSTNNTPVGELDATNATFTIPNAQSADSGLYAVVVSNSFNSVMSQFATLIVGNVTPSLNGPFNETVIQGNNATFSASVLIANPAPTFQWQTNGVDVAGATGLSLTLADVQYGLNGATVSLIASNAAAEVTNSATLNVIVTPAITPQPTNVTVSVGATATFTSGATGVPTPGLQWYENGSGLSGQTGSTLTIANAQGSNIGGYYLVATNSAGSVTSSIVTLTVNSTTLSALSFSPTNGATGICYDTPLYVTFNGPVSIVNSGSIRIYNITNSTTPVDVINMNSNAVVVSPTINLTNNIQAHSLFYGDTQVINYYPVIINGETAAIYPHGGVLTSNQTYYVTMDNGIVADSSGAYFEGISATNEWQFTTKPTGPANPTNLVVAADGSGDFATVQGAVDSIPGGNTNYTVVNINSGNYVEIVDISGKSNITFYGESRAGTVVGYPNNNNLTGTTAARMAFKVNGADIKLENLTITNGTPQGGSQAEALLVYNNGLRCVVDNCDIVSRQDTILINANTSQAYFNNCLVIGNFDYIWGVGVGYFNDCVFRTITNSLSTSYNLTAARTATSSSLSATTPWVNPNGTTYSAYGFTFVDCTFTEDPGVTGISLADANGTPGGLVSFVDCTIDTNAYVNPLASINGQYVFWQYNNTNSAATGPASFTQVQTIGVTNNDPRLLASTNVITWFSGWSPMLLPYITTQPVGETVAANQDASFTVAASGVPDPAYQWLFDGTNLVGQTGATLDINNASGLNIGTYAVVVSNSVGNVTSTNVVLTVNAPTTQSVVGTPSLSGGVFQFNLSGPAGSAGFGYRVWSTTNLALTPVIGNWTLVTNGVFGTGTTTISDPSAAELPNQYYLITVP
jgi:autotransporter-associated beta strand protein